MKFTVATTVTSLAAPASFLGAGAAYLQYRAAGVHPMPAEWVHIELQRALNFAHVPQAVQAFFADSNIRVTGAYIHSIDLQSSTLSESVQFWLMNMHRAETIGLLCAAGTTIVTFGIVFLLSTLTARRAKRAAQRALKKQTAASRLSGARRRQIELAGVPLPEWALTRHILLPGSTGSGKSVAISSLVAQIREKGGSGVVLDYRGELTERFYLPGDTVLNHFDARDPGWSPLAEFETDYELDHVVENYLPCTGANPAHDHFQKAGQVILEPIFRAARSNLEIWQVLGDRRRLEDMVRSNVAKWFVDPDTRSAGDNMTTLINALWALRHLPAHAGRNPETQSVRAWVRGVRQKPGPFLWITIPPQARRAIMPLVPLWLGLAITEVLTLPETTDWALPIITDELGQLGPISDLPAALTAGRKPGLCVISGVQTLAQLRHIYGVQNAQVLMSCYSTKLILRQGDADGAEYWSRELGDREVREWHRTEGESTGEGRDSKSSGQSEHVRVKRTVLASELQELPDLEGYLKIAHFPAARVELARPNTRPSVTAPFLPRQPGSQPTALEASRGEAAAQPDSSVIDVADSVGDLDLSALDESKRQRT